MTNTTEHPTAPAQPAEVGQVQRPVRPLLERMRTFPMDPNTSFLLGYEAANEIERLQVALKAANAQAERFERGWYLRGDALEKIKGVVCGDRTPRWASEESVYAARGWIVDTCDAGLNA